MTFFNPASLLASPEAAVKAPPPETNTAAFAIGSAMEAIRDNLKKKKEVDDLTANTESLASYMDSRSPDLANFLRSRVETYKPTAFTGYDAIDVKGEKDKLLSGVISLYGQELQANKLEASDNSVALQNNYGAKLRAAESFATNLNNNWNTWESNENRKEAEYNDTWRALAKQGKATGIQPYQRSANPYTADRDAANSTYKSLLNADQGSILNMATPSKVTDNGQGIIKHGGAGNSGDGNGGAYGKDSGVAAELPVMGEGGVDTSGAGLLLPPPGGSDSSGPANDILENPGNSQSTEAGAPIEIQGPSQNSSEGLLKNDNNDLVNKVPITPPMAKAPDPLLPPPVIKSSGVITTHPISSAPISTHPNDALNAAALKEQSDNVTAINFEFNQAMKSIETQKKTYVDEKAADTILDYGKQAKVIISTFSNPGSKEWLDQAKGILLNYKAQIAGLQRNSAASEKRQQEVANQEQLQYYVKDSVKKDPVTIYKRIQDGVPRFYITEQGKEVEVTNQIGTTYLPFDSQSTDSTKVNVTKPGAQIKSVSDILNR